MALTLFFLHQIVHKPYRPGFKFRPIFKRDIFKWKLINDFCTFAEW